MLAPALLRDAAVVPLDTTAGSSSDVTLSFTLASDADSQSTRARVIFPESYTFNVTKPELPIKSIEYRTPDASTYTSICQGGDCPTASQFVAVGAPQLYAVLPTAMYSDVSQGVTVFGANFDVDASDIRVKIGEQQIPVQSVLTSQKLLIQVDCANELRCSALCSLQEPTGVVKEQRGCPEFLTPSATVPDGCGRDDPCPGGGNATLRAPSRVAHMIEVSSDGGQTYTRNLVEFAMYRKLASACPNNCGGDVRSTSCNFDLSPPSCFCKDSFSGIDCGTAPTPLRVISNFGPRSGGSRVQITFAYEEKFDTIPDSFRCIFGDRIIQASLVDDDNFIYTIECDAPAVSGNVWHLDVDLSIKTKEVCINGEGCCSTRDECFKGFLSNLTLPFYYFDHEPTQTKSWARLSSDRNAHTLCASAA